MVVEFGEFKGNKIIKLMRDENDKYGFSFGYGKAKMVLEHLDDIKKFVEETEAQKAQEETVE